MEAEKSNANKANLEVIQFCPACFATEDDGSWGCTVIGDYCTNCGAGGSVSLPRWAVRSIRQQASWVGKRYYPCDEDFERYEELKALRALVKEFPGRTAERDREDPNRYWVKQKLAENKTISVSVIASSIEAAIEGSRYSLPYVPEVASKDEGKADPVTITETRS